MRPKPLRNGGRGGERAQGSNWVERSLLLSWEKDPGEGALIDQPSASDIYSLPVTRMTEAGQLEKDGSMSDDEWELSPIFGVWEAIRSSGDCGRQSSCF